MNFSRVVKRVIAILAITFAPYALAGDGNTNVSNEFSVSKIVSQFFGFSSKSKTNKLVVREEVLEEESTSTSSSSATQTAPPVQVRLKCGRSCVVTVEPGP